MVDKTTGNNSEPDQNQGGVDAPSYVTAEQVAQIVNSAITNRNRQFEGKLDEKFTRLEALLAPKSEVSEEPSKPSKVSMDPKVMQLENQLKALQAERHKSRDQSLKARTQQLLIEQGVNPKAIKPLIAMLVDAERTISYASDDSDDIIFKQADYHVPLQDGVAGWLKSEDAKPFIAPIGAVGSGDRKYQTQTSKPTDVKSKEEAGQRLANFLLGQ